MDIKYKIIETFPEEHLIVVRYYTDSLPENDLASAPELNKNGSPVRCRTDIAITLPIPMPSDDEIEDIISKQCPTAFFELKEKIKDPSIDTTMSSIKKKMNKERKVKFKPKPTETLAPNTK